MENLGIIEMQLVQSFKDGFALLQGPTASWNRKNEINFMNAVQMRKKYFLTLL